MSISVIMAVLSKALKLNNRLGYYQKFFIEGRCSVMLFGRKGSYVEPSVMPEAANATGSGRVNYPRLYQGAVLNLLNSDSAFLGKALLRNFSVHELDLVRPEGVLSLPVVSPDDIINVQGCADNGASFTLQTRVFQASRLNIRLRDLALVTDVNQRNSPRFFVNRPAAISDKSVLEFAGPSRFKPELDMCVLVDISMDGARVRSSRKYAMEEALKLRVELYERAGKISFMSQVVRVVELPDGQFEYGLLFEALPASKRQYLAEDLRHLAGK